VLGPWSFDKENKMKFTKALLIALSVLATCSFLLPAAGADQWNKKTKVTFSQPVEVPGAGAQILPAGTYVFKLVDSQSDRNIVRIFNEDETQVFTTILAITNYRLHPTDETVLTFRERAAGSPQAIRAWFYPGENWGQEFVYPKARAIELAKITQEPVLETPAELANEPLETFKTAPVETVQPSGDVVEQAKVVEPTPVEEAKAVESGHPTLPQTASPLPLLGLAGLLTLGAGFAVSLFRKRTA
jgi:LPXTG-motif cell wall-anchored protein